MNQIPVLYENYLNILKNETHLIRPYYVFITNNMTLIYIILVFVILIFCLVLGIITKLFGASRLQLPGPFHCPFFGSLYEFIKNKKRFYNWLLTCARKYGKSGVFYFSIPGKSPYIFLLKPEYLKEILKDNMDNYHRKPIYEACDELLGKGIFNVDGIQWHQQRIIASHGFNTSQLNNNALICFKNTTQKLVEKIKQYANDNIEFDLKDLFYRTTMDSICKIAFDYDINSVTSENMPAFAVAIDKCTRHLFNRMINPLWRIKKIISLQDEIEYKNDIAKLNELCYEIIEERIAKLKSISAIDDIDQFIETSDILSLFTSAIIKAFHSKYPQKETDIDEIFGGYISEIFAEYHEPIKTKAYLRDIVFSFIIAGRDTTASTLSWLFFEILVKEDIIERIENEVTHTNNLETYYDYRNNLQVIQSTFYETLRLHPPVPIDVKYSEKDTILGDNTHTAIYIPKGAAVIYSPYIMGRLSHIWDDPDIFDIDRKHTSKTPYEFPCFNAGRRICLGKDFAILEAKVIMTELFKNFKFVGTDKKIYNKPAQYSFGVTSSPNHSIMVRAQLKN